jgi:hypothetical protein
MVVGLGALGGTVLELLARSGGVQEIVAADVNEDWGVRKTNNAVFGAALQGFYPKMSFRRVDLNDVEGTASLLEEVKPDVLFACVTLQSWWVTELLPPHLSEIFRRAGSGPRIPMQLALAHKLMRAVKRSGIEVRVVNSSYPDAVNPILSRIGLAPTVGVGNSDLLIPRMQKVISEMLHIPMRNVEIYFVAHHFHIVSVGRTGSAEGAPYWLKILAEGKDVTEKLGAEKVLAGCRVPVPPPLERQGPIASSCVKNILAILNDANLLTHAPGPKGLVGGYPVRLNASGAEVVLPDGMALDEAVKINEEAQKYDGVEAILSDGTVRVTEEAARIMRETLGYECREIRVEEAERKAEEFARLFKIFVERHKGG